MIGQGINTHPIFGTVSSGQIIEIQDIIKKYCVDGIINKKVSLSGIITQNISLSGTVNKKVNFNVTLNLDC
jgi:hypothetical protein